MDNKEHTEIRQRIEANCKENRTAINASRNLEEGLTDKSIKMTPKNFDKVMKARGITPKEAEATKNSFENRKMEARHAAAGEKFVVTNGFKRSSGVYVSKESLGSTPEERINRGALPKENTAEYETNVVLDKPQVVITGRIAAQPRFEKEDPNHLARNGGGEQTVTNGGFEAGAIRQSDSRYPVPSKNKDIHPVPMKTKENKQSR